MRGSTRLRLEVRDDNVRAINLYERMSYSRFGVMPGYYADGADRAAIRKAAGDAGKRRRGLPEPPRHERRCIG